MSVDLQESGRERLRRLRPRIYAFGVKRAWLFGSRARGQAATRSDWDVLVEFDEPPSFDDFMGLKIMLEDELKAPVDVLSRSACTPRFLRAIEAELLDVA